MKRAILFSVFLFCLSSFGQHGYMQLSGMVFPASVHGSVTFENLGTASLDKEAWYSHFSSLIMYNMYPHHYGLINITGQLLVNGIQYDVRPGSVFDVQSRTSILDFDTYFVRRTAAIINISGAYDPHLYNAIISISGVGTFSGDYPLPNNFGDAVAGSRSVSVTGNIFNEFGISEPVEWSGNWDFSNGVLTIPRLGAYPDGYERYSPPFDLSACTDLRGDGSIYYQDINGTGVYYLRASSQIRALAGVAGTSKKNYSGNMILIFERDPRPLGISVELMKKVPFLDYWYHAQGMYNWLPTTYILNAFPDHFNADNPFPEISDPAKAFVAYSWILDDLRNYAYRVTYPNGSETWFKSRDDIRGWDYELDGLGWHFIPLPDEIEMPIINPAEFKPFFDDPVTGLPDQIVDGSPITDEPLELDPDTVPFDPNDPYSPPVNPVNPDPLDPSAPMPYSPVAPSPAPYDPILPPEDIESGDGFLGAIMDKIRMLLSDWRDGSTILINGIGEALNGLSNMIKGRLDALGRGVNQAVDKISGIGNSVVDGTAAIINELKDSVLSIGQKQDETNDLLTEIKDNLSDDEAPPEETFSPFDLDADMDVGSPENPSASEDLFNTVADNIVKSNAILGFVKNWLGSFFTLQLPNSVGQTPQIFVSFGGGVVAGGTGLMIGLPSGMAGGIRAFMSSCIWIAGIFSAISIVHRTFGG